MAKIYKLVVIALCYLLREVNMIKKIFALLFFATITINLVACGGSVSATNSNGEVKKISLNNFEIIDFDENDTYGNMFDLSRCFDIVMEYKGLPNQALKNTKAEKNDVRDALDKSAFGYLFEDDANQNNKNGSFRNTYRPYVVYSCKLKLKDDCYIDEKKGFYIRLAKFNDVTGEVYYGESINIANSGSTEVELHLFSRSHMTASEDNWNDYKHYVEMWERDEIAFNQHLFPVGTINSFNEFSSNFKPLDFGEITGVIYKSK